MVLHRGKIARNPTITNVRALTRDDLMLLHTERESADRQGTNRIARLRDPHHRLARLIAAGLKLTEAAERAGFSYSRACLLQKDPSFAELIAHYRGKIDEAFIGDVDEHHRAAFQNMRMAETQLAEKLEIAEETGEYLPTRDLIAITSDRMDRFGYGKRQTNTNINVDFAATLERARARTAKPTLIEARVVASPVPQYPQRPLGVPASADGAGELSLPNQTARLVRRI